MAEVFVKQLQGQRLVTGLNGVHYGDVFFLGMGGFLFALVHHGDKCTTRIKVTEHLRQHGVADKLCHQHMKISKQFGAIGNIAFANGRAFEFDMVFERFDMLGFQIGDERTNHPGF